MAFVAYKLGGKKSGCRKVWLSNVFFLWGGTMSGFHNVPVAKYLGGKMSGWQDVIGTRIVGGKM